MGNTDLFISLDVETLGPIPGKHPMIELGAAAFNIDGVVESTWRASMTQDGMEAHPATLKWWLHPENYKVFQQINEDTQEPKDAMPAFRNWLGDMVKREHQVMPVCYPAAFDYMFVYWYLINYTGAASPFTFNCIDVRSYVSGARKTRYRQASKRTFPKRWFHPDLNHTHNALDDAIEQGWMFIQAYRENNNLQLLSPNDLVING